MSNKKILFIHHLSVIGGATKSLLSLVKATKARGFDVSVLFYGEKGNAYDWFTSQDIDCHNFNNGKVFQHANGAYIPLIQKRPYRVFTIFFKAINSIKETKSVIASYSPDLVYLNTSLLFPAAIAAKQLNNKVIWHLREQIHDGLFGIRKKIIRFCFNNYSDKIIAISGTNASKINSEKCKVIYNSTNSVLEISENKLIDLKSKLKITDEKIICFLGGNVKSKGADLLFKTIKILKKSNKKFIVIIAGKFSLTGPNLNKIEIRVKKIIDSDPEILDYIRFTGVLEDVSVLLKLSQILVWPANTSHFARPIIEAMMNETLVLASNFESSREIINHGVTGFLAKNIVSDFSEQLICLLDTDETFDEIILNAKEKALLLFSQEQNLNKNIQLISNTIEKKALV